MKKVKLAILGLGNVPLALLRFMRQPQAKAALDALGAEIIVTGVTTGRRGNAISPQGLRLEDLETAGKEGNIAALNKGPETSGNLEFISRVSADILFVATPAKFSSLDAIKTAFSRGINVITSNKTPVANYYSELLAEARKHNARFRFGATVLAGYPPWRQFFDSITRPEIAEIQMAVNATSNNILTLMLEKEMSFEQGVAEAQTLGIAERDVSDDVDGHDTQKKLTILANVLMDAGLTAADIPTQGIRGITVEHLRLAAREGKWIQLLGRAWMENGAIRAEVKPVSTDNPFFTRMRGTSMGLYFVTPAANFGIWLDLGQGQRAIMATAAGVFEDVLSIIKGGSQNSQ